MINSYLRPIRVSGMDHNNQNKGLMNTTVAGMKTVKFAAVARLFQSIPSTVDAANRCERAYYVGENKPHEYVEFGADKPEAVAMAIAGLYAADTAANIIAAFRDGFNGEGKVDESAYTEALRAIATGDLDEFELYTAKNAANLSWRAGQPFRGIASKPLERLTRPINMQFNMLPSNEENKDLVQVVEGAKILLGLAE